MLRDVLIHPVLNGWVVTVGCQKVVFNDLGCMMSAIRRYLEDPEEAEKSFRESVNAKWVWRDNAVAAEHTITWAGSQRGTASELHTQIIEEQDAALAGPSER